MATRSKPVIAVDVGGTFTDVCLLDPESGRLDVAKVPSTADPIDGVLSGVGQADVDLADVGLFSHGTTVATNALITRNLPRMRTDDRWTPGSRVQLGWLPEHAVVLR